MAAAVVKAALTSALEMMLVLKAAETATAMGSPERDNEDVSSVG